MEPTKTANPLKREPVVIVGIAAGIVADAISGTGSNSTWAGVAVAVLVSALRFFMDSPATSEYLRSQLPPRPGAGAPTPGV